MTNKFVNPKLLDHLTHMDPDMVSSVITNGTPVKIQRTIRMRATQYEEEMKVEARRAVLHDLVAQLMKFVEIKHARSDYSEDVVIQYTVHVLAQPSSYDLTVDQVYEKIRPRVWQALASQAHYIPQPLRAEIARVVIEFMQKNPECLNDACDYLVPLIDGAQFQRNLRQAVVEHILVGD